MTWMVFFGVLAIVGFAVDVFASWRDKKCPKRKGHDWNSEVWGTIAIAGGLAAFAGTPAFVVAAIWQFAAWVTR